MKEIFIIEENEANCSNRLKKSLLSTGFQPVTIHAKPDVGLSDNLQYVKHCMSLLQTDAPGLIGIGYGGAVACHLLAESERFRAAVLIGALTNPATAYGTGRGVISPTVGENFRMLEYLSSLTNESVVQYCDEIHTPILLLHGLQDEVYGFEQAEQLFTSIKERNPAGDLRMVVFPDAGHELPRGHYAERCEAEIIRWFTSKTNGGMVSA